MPPARRQYELKKNGVTQKDIALELTVTEMSVSRVINSLGVSDRIMRAVAAKIGKPVERVFPEYYLRPAKRTTSKSLQV